MINVSLQYAIVLLKEMDTKPVGVIRSIDMSTKHNLSPYLVDQVLRRLKTIGVVGSHRGPHGGYYRKRPQVSLLELFDLLAPIRGTDKFPEATPTIQNLKASIQLITV